MCLIVASVVVTIAPKDTAEALTNMTQTFDIGDLLVANYETKDKKFDAATVKKLYEMITGQSGATYQDVKNATGKASTSRDSTFFKTTSVNTAQKDLIVTFGGYTWSVMYLSSARNGDPIVSLWLADSSELPVSYQKAPWNGYYDTNNGAYPSNMYGTSKIRAVTLNNGGNYATSVSNLTTAQQDPNHPFAKFTMENEVGSLTEFIARPSEVAWQETETTGDWSIGYDISNNNDAYSVNPPAKPNVLDYTVAPAGVADRATAYTAWKDDYIWLPSFTESGWYEGVYTARGMWNSDAYRRGNAVGVNSWSRSANHDSGYGAALCLTYEGSTCYHIAVSTELAVRPALHLNLRKVEGLLIEPNDQYSFVYAGKQFAMGDVSTADKTWFDSSIININYIDSYNRKDVGKHMIEASIKSDKRARYTFDGTPNIQNNEDDYTRYFYFIITEKEIGVDLTLVDNVPQAKAKSGAVYSDDTGDRAPKFAFTYQDIDSGQTYDEYPTEILGNYKATVKIANKCNYVLDDTYSINFSIEKTRVQQPTISKANREKPYTGSPIPFNLSQTKDIAKIDVKVTPTGSCVNNVVSATAAGTYTVTFSLLDTAKTCWDTAAPDDTDPFTIEIKITQATLAPTITCSDEDASWGVGESLTMTITDNRISGDNIDYYVYYLISGDSTKYDDIDSTKVVTDGSVTVTMPNDLSIGSYTFVVELSKSKNNDNGNYIINGSKKEKPFTIVGGGITVTASSIKWQVNGADIGALTNDKLILTYNGTPFKFGIDDSNLQSMGVKIDTTKGANNGFEGDIEQTGANELYQVKVYLCNYDNTFATWSGSFTLKYEIKKAKYNMDEVKWSYDPAHPLKYTGNLQTITLTNLPSTLTVIDDGYEGNRQRNAKDGYVAVVLGFDNADSNYVKPEFEKPDTYDGNFDWSITWSIAKATLELEWENKQIAGLDFKVPQVKGANAQYVDNAKYKYYKSSGVSVGDPIALGDIQVGESAVRYWVEAVLMDSASQNYEISGSTKMKSFRVGSDFDKVVVELDTSSFIYDGSSHGGELKVTSGAIDISNIIAEYYKDSVSDANKLPSAPTDVGNYIVVLSLSEQAEDDGYALGKTQLTYTIGQASVKAEWDTSGQIPVIAGLDDTLKEVVGYVYYDEQGNELADGAELEVGKKYKVKAIIQGSHAGNYKFVAEDGSDLPNLAETQPQDFTVTENPNGGNHGGNVGIGSGDSGEVDNSGNQGGGNGNSALDELLAKLKEMPLWQIIAGVISAILTIVFLSKTASYDAKRKKFNKKADKLGSGVYAAAPFLGLATSIWTAIACVLIGLAVVSFVMMLIAKSRCNKAEEEYEESLEEYQRNKADLDERKRDESMRMMLMGMMGGNGGQQGFAYAGQPPFGLEDMRGMINEAVTAMLPGVQQAIPQQASGNDELVEKLLEKTAKNEDTIQKLMKKIAEQPTEKVIEREVAASNVSDEVIKKLVKNQELLMKRIGEQPVETVIAREVAVANANDETIKSLIEGQKAIMQQLAELSANQNTQPQVVEKVIEKEVPVEKIVEKVVEVPVEVEKIVEKEVVKEVPVEVEKIVEKEVKVEVPVEVEKIVEKEVVKEVKVEVPVAVPTPSKPKKEVAPRLTLDEAYTLLSKQQQKYFDGLRQYALSKPNSKEKKSTYFTVFGQSTVNPLMKLTIKKDTVVALFKMEDEYMKDIRRDATGDGTKIKVKETEVIISDAQACKAAKNMIDLREDQIERYQDLLKEQRAMKNKK
ncbi:MAG: hypothetical protein K2I23_04730 [Clostridia bacterium]|nr:hypothetical protein [Clostridia bacterium]